MRAMTEEYLEAHGLRRAMVSTPVPQRVALALQATSKSPDARRGTTTWRAWLRASVNGVASPRAAA